MQLTEIMVNDAVTLEAVIVHLLEQKCEFAYSGITEYHDMETNCKQWAGTNPFPVEGLVKQLRNSPIPGLYSRAHFWVEVDDETAVWLKMRI